MGDVHVVLFFVNIDGTFDIYIYIYIYTYTFLGSL
jgi:hypothetical protein